MELLGNMELFYMEFLGNISDASREHLEVREG